MGWGYIFHSYLQEERVHIPGGPMEMPCTKVMRAICIALYPYKANGKYRANEEFIYA